MATVVGPAITPTNPFARLSVPGDIRDFYDSANHRFLSGYVASVISQLALAGTFGAGDTVDVVVKPPNYDPTCGHTKLTYYPTATGNVFTGLSYTVNTANNYGLPGPSARVEGDGTVSYIDVEITLTPASDASTSSLTPTLTYTHTTTQKNPYADLTGTVITATLTLHPENDQQWGTITYPVTNLVAVGVQFQSLTSSVQNGLPPGADSPVFQAMNVPQSSGQQICNFQMPLGRTVGRSKTFPFDNYTWI